MRAWLDDSINYHRRDTDDCTIDPGDPEWEESELGYIDEFGALESTAEEIDNAAYAREVCAWAWDHRNDDGGEPT